MVFELRPTFPWIAANRQPDGWVFRISVDCGLVSSEQPQVYTYKQVADRVEQVLGERPSLSALRAEAAKERQTPTTQANPRLTLRLPAPLPRPSGSGPARFSADEVEQWLLEHPRRRWMQVMEQARADLAAGKGTEQVVEGVLAAGASWRNVAQLLTGMHGQPQTLAGVHKRFRHLKTEV